MSTDDTSTPSLIKPLDPVEGDTQEPGPTFRQLGVQALDSAGRPFTGVAAAWKSESDRRSEARSADALKTLREANKDHREAMRNLRSDQKMFEKARSEVAWWNVFNGERRAAASVVRDSRQMAGEARAARRAARHAYPMTLPSLALRCHTAHALPSATWALLSDSYVATGAFGVSVAAVALNTVGVALGMRHVRNDATAVAAGATAVALQPSQEEGDLLQRLDPKAWPGFAEPRGLSGVVSAGAVLTASGIQAKLTLDGTMTLDKLRGQEAQLRAALRLREGTRLELREGATGGHARMTLRTRSAAAGADMEGWTPGAPWGVNTVTGETFPIPRGKRLLIAGTSGGGKTASARPLMAEASEYPDHRLVIFDRKYVEARNWSHRARVATELDEMRELCGELIEEGEARKLLIPRGQDTIEISATRPRITVFVDEGAELIEDSKTKHQADEAGRKNYDDIMVALRTIARKYRYVEIVLVWCTQKPALSGEGHGLDSQISGNIMKRLSLSLATQTDTQVVFGSDAVEKGWKANELPMPGFALFRDQELGNKSVPQMLKMRYMTSAQVIALPDRTVWSRPTGRATAGDVAARKVLEAAAPVDPWAKLPGDGATLLLGSDVDSVSSAPTVRVPLSGPRVPAADRDDQIMDALRATPCVRLSDLADAVGVNKGTVKRTLDRLAADGLVARDPAGCWSVVGE